MVVATCTIDKRIALPGLMGQGVLEDSGDLPPPFGRHARGASVNRVYSRTRTTCHPRSTVALEILGASAVSPTESPPDDRTSATRLFRESHDASSISASSRHGENLPAVPALQARSTRHVALGIRQVGLRGPIVSIRPYRVKPHLRSRFLRGTGAGVLDSGAAEAVKRNRSKNLD